MFSVFVIMLYYTTWGCGLFPGTASPVPVKPEQLGITDDDLEVSFLRDGELWMGTLNGEERKVVDSGLFYIDAYSWSPNGRYIALLNYDDYPGKTGVYDLGKEQMVLKVAANYSTWSSDNCLVYVMQDGRSYVLYYYNPTDGRTSSIYRSSSMISSAVWNSFEKNVVAIQVSGFTYGDYYDYDHSLVKTVVYDIKEEKVVNEYKGGMSPRWGKHGAYLFLLISFLCEHEYTYFESMVKWNPDTNVAISYIEFEERMASYYNFNYYLSPGSEQMLLVGWEKIKVLDVKENNVEALKEQDIMCTGSDWSYVPFPIWDADASRFAVLVYVESDNYCGEGAWDYYLYDREINDFLLQQENLFVYEDYQYEMFDYYTDFIEWLPHEKVLFTYMGERNQPSIMISETGKTKKMTEVFSNAHSPKRRPGN